MNNFWLEFLLLHINGRCFLVSMASFLCSTQVNTLPVLGCTLFVAAKGDGKEVARFACLLVKLHSGKAEDALLSSVKTFIGYSNVGCLRDLARQCRV